MKIERAEGVGVEEKPSWGGGGKGPIQANENSMQHNLTHMLGM